MRSANSRPITLAIDRKGRSLGEQAAIKAAEEEIARQIEAEMLARLAEVEAAGGATGLLQPEPEPNLDGRDAALAPNQGGSGPVIVFDWDCTITCKHMYKVLAGWRAYW